MKSKFAVIFIFVLAAGVLCAYAAAEKPVVSMKAHAENGLSCADCHKTENPDKRAPASSCKGCHENKDGTYKGILGSDGNPVKKDYPEGQAKKTVNMHDSHQGEIRCTQCHTYHKEPILYCNECHAFDVKVK